jgi:hypothetical protein
LIELPQRVAPAAAEELHSGLGSAEGSQEPRGPACSAVWTASGEEREDVDDKSGCSKDWPDPDRRRGDDVQLSP